MRTVTITEAAKNLEEYIRLLETGQEDIINIMIDGKETAQIVSIPKIINRDIAEQTVQQSIEQGYLTNFLNENRESVIEGLMSDLEHEYLVDKYISGIKQDTRTEEKKIFDEKIQKIIENMKLAGLSEDTISNILAM